jgi:hypothetical protein
MTMVLLITAIASIIPCLLDGYKEIVDILPLSIAWSTKGR